MSEHWTENTKALKISIAVMTALLVIGLIVLVVGMARTAGKLSRGDSVAMVGEHRVTIPTGSRVQSVSADGGRLYVTLEGADGTTILILDGSTGQQLGAFRLGPP